MRECFQRIIEISPQLDWINMLAAGGTIIAAVAAAFSANSAKKAAVSSEKSNLIQEKNIKLQNKLNLFDKRFEIYIAVKNYYKLFYQCRDKFEKLKEYPTMSALIELYVLCGAGDKLKLTEADRSEMRGIYLAATRSIDILIEKIDLLFNGKTSRDVSEFLRKYDEFITCLYEYQEKRNNLLKDMSEEGEFEALFTAFNDVEKTVKNIENKFILEKMKNEVEPR